MNVRKIFILIALFFSFNCLYFTPSYSEGGMYPVSQLYKIDLKNIGINLSINEIYSPDSISLLQAIVSLGGCTGSFVSPEGLILTNHHCVFGSLKTYSSVDKNLMETGFTAVNKQQELPIKGMIVKILVGYKDVSSQVMEGISPLIDPIVRRVKIQNNIERIIKEESRDTTKIMEISEMLSGKSYVLFKYQELKDIRIVYVPPRQIGEFGGETDNWMWPRHSGDFSFIRAYVSPNGEAKGYDVNNVPFKPASYLKINTHGIQEGDFVFIAGYPGRTYRNRPAEFIRYMESYYMPFIADFYEYKINYLHSLTVKSNEMKIKYDPMIKGLANVSKNYRGKLKSLKNIRLYEKKKEEEADLAKKFNNDSLSGCYLKVLNNINQYYHSLYGIAERYIWYLQASQSSNAFNIARDMVNYAKLCQKKGKNDKVSQSAYLQFLKSYKAMDISIDSVFIKELLLDAGKFINGISGLNEYLGTRTYKNGVEQFITKAYRSKLLLPGADQYVLKLLNDPEKILKLKDPWIRFFVSVYYDYAEVDSSQRVYFNSIDALLPAYVDLKMKASGEMFIPDANSTLRLTYGYIKGYYSADAIYNSPFTTLSGILEKVAIGEEYIAYPKLITEIDKLRVSKYIDPKLNSIPVCMLYNCDTTGGNSGSPVLNANGELIGLNFDRTFEATVNDFAWNDKYSRSIGLDMRYLLFVVKNVAGADYLTKEMGLE